MAKWKDSSTTKAGLGHLKNLKPEKLEDSRNKKLRLQRPAEFQRALARKMLNEKGQKKKPPSQNM